MPEIRYYRVTQTREVRVEAQDPLSAAHIAQTAFDHDAEGVNSLESNPFQGRTTARPRDTGLDVREDF